MFKFQALAVQCDALGERFMGTIETIAQDGTIDRCQLAADLVFASSNEPNAQKRVGRSASEDSVLEDRCLSIGMIGTDKARDRVLWATQQRLLKASFDGRRGSRNDSPILFVNSMFAKLFAESRCALARPSKGYSACHGCIEPADNPEIHVARLMVLVLQIQAGGF